LDLYWIAGLIIEAKLGDGPGSPAPRPIRCETDRSNELDELGDGRNLQVSEEWTITTLRACFMVRQSLKRGLILKVPLIF
jgi:hypothetical protein